MARMSSAMASVWKKTLVSGATRSPSSDMTPRAKAMSVAMGMAQPESVLLGLIVRKMKAGTATPPTAASMGRAA